LINTVTTTKGCLKEKPTMATITKVQTMTSDDGRTFETAEAWCEAYDAPTSGFIEGVTWVYALVSPTSVTRTITFADQATFDAWNANAPRYNNSTKDSDQYKGDAGNPVTVSTD
jgi:hypothetical protein